MPEWVALSIPVWLVTASAVGLLVGRVIKLRDERG